ncbi:murein transglycosylase A [Parvularcula lutaonensis]|uniref:peptidoglycan lytic exotransglycosylase n=1 Tax=Parvularcula lutaonensis TaxID=491923 RepID=A0ABV7MAH5_9PROT|nr:MltA domain-containing protein [Parvularcula lutaonensis]GGY36028.1 membrane-bound lytic murein transglycosylase A [Parvularcula lutaonensis]
MRKILPFLLVLTACAPFGKEPPAFERMAVTEIEGFGESPLLPAVRTFVKSCDWLTEKNPVLGGEEDWQPVCQEAEFIATEGDARVFFTSRFDAVKLHGGHALVTGYYEPVFEASAARTEAFDQPVLARPEDLVAVDLGAFRDDLKGRRIAGRIEDGRLVPYADREAIELSPPAEAEILGYMRADDLFFLQIQGSGVLEFPEGARRIGYAAQNGHPYKAIGKTLVEEGHMALEDVTMQSIRQWLATAPEEDAARVRASNPSYVFFTDRGPAEGDEGPLGTAGVPLTADYSVAVDRFAIPLGAPVFISGEDDVLSISKLTVAQDTGGAIRGPDRVDLFLGRGDEAGETAGRLKLDADIVVLIPKGAALPIAEPGA